MAFVAVEKWMYRNLKSPEVCDKDGRRVVVARFMVEVRCFGRGSIIFCFGFTYLFLFFCCHSEEKIDVVAIIFIIFVLLHDLQRTLCRRSIYRT